MKKSILLLTAISSFLGFGAHAIAQTWDGGGTDNNWSTPLNWSTDTIPATGPVFFSNTDKTSSSTVNSIVDQDFTLDALTFDNTGTTANDWQYVSINSGVTLTLNAATAPATILTVGNVNGNSSGSATITTRAKIGGAGSLVINEPTSNIIVGNYDNSATGGAATGELNLSGLASFTATVANFNIGLGNRSVGLVTLGTSNTITASILSVGYSANLNPNTASILNLGSTNTINAANIYVGAPAATGNNSASGTLRFDPSLAGGATETLTIRGQTGGSSRANLIIGQNSNDKTSAATRAVAGIVDFTGGSVDAMLDNLVLAHSEGNTSSASLTGTLTMNLGTINANTVVAGRTDLSSTATAPAAVGTINISGGTFEAGAMTLGYNVGGAQSVEGVLNVSGTGTVNATAGIVMGRRWPTASASSVKATLDISGGTVTSGGNIAEHAENTNVASTLRLRGGTLDLTGNDIVVDTLTVESGTLKNVKQINSGGTLTKTTVGTLVIEGTNDYTGPTQVSAGTLRVDGSLTASAVTVADQATLAGSGTIGGSVTINAGGTLSPGNSGPATLATGSLGLASTAQLVLSLNGSAPGTGYDNVNVTGGVNLNTDLGAGANLSLTLAFAPVAGQYFTLIGNDGVDAVAGAFATINGLAFGPGNTFSLTYNSQSYDFELSYTGQSSSLLGGNDVVILAVPEPSVWALSALGLGAFLVFRRARLA